MPEDYSFFLEGGDKGVLLVHGLTGTPAEMKLLGKRLQRKGFTVYAPTLAGHCLEEKDLIATRYEDWLASLSPALHYFKDKVKEVYIAGICVGGVLGLCLARLEPSIVKKAVILAPTLNYDGWNQPYFFRIAFRFSNLLVKVPGIKKLRFKERSPYGIKSERIRKAIAGANNLEGAYDYFPGLSIYENFRLVREFKKLLPGIKTPTLLIHAKEDDIGHPRSSYLIKKLHGGPCDVVLLEDSYHMIHIDQERNKVADLAAEFFNS